MGKETSDEFIPASQGPNIFSTDLLHIRVKIWNSHSYVGNEYGGSHPQLTDSHESHQWFQGVMVSSSGGIEGRTGPMIKASTDI